MQSLAALVRDIKAAEEVGTELSEDDKIRKLVGQDIPERHVRNGGVVLTVIWDRMHNLSGDPMTHSLYSHLLSLASTPYFAMLQKWIHDGLIDDPYEEFMIISRASSVKKESLNDLNYAMGDVYWEQRYALRNDAVPPFLEAYKDRILQAGKYWNVIRECKGKADASYSLGDAGSKSWQTGTSAKGDWWIPEIEEAYKEANRRLLDLLIKDGELVARLRCVSVATHQPSHFEPKTNSFFSVPSNTTYSSTKATT